VAPRYTQQAEEPEQDEVTRPSDLGFGPQREIEVDRVQLPPQFPDDQGFVQIRMNTTIEEFTYGNTHQQPVRLERGKVYRVPRHIAGYLDSLEYVWH